MRGSRRSFATRPSGTLPTPLGARPAPIRKNGGTLIPTRRRRADSGESLNSVGWSGSLAGAASPMEVLLHFNPPARRRPDYRPGSLRSQAQAHLSAAARPKACRSLFDPPHCAGKRTDQPEGESSRSKAWPPIPTACRTGRARTRGGRRRTIGAPCGRQSPAGSRSPSRRPSLSRSPLACTEVQPREPRGSTTRRFRVPSLI